MSFGRYRIGITTAPRWEGWRRFEYWDRLVLGPIYILRYPR